MSQEGPRVSVVLPARNAEATIIPALKSVVRQTFRDWELIVCDDGSTDGTRQVAESFLSGKGVEAWRILALDHGGPSASRNAGIRSARGEFVAFLDDDDSWEPRKLERCVEVLMGTPLDIVCHEEYWVTSDRRTIRRYSALYDSRLPPLVSLMRNNPFSTSAVVLRRSLFDAAGLFDTSLPSAEDYDMWIRLVMVPGVRIGFIEEPLGSYALRPGSESAATERRLQALLAIGRRYSENVRQASRLGRLEVWMFRARVYFTTGIRLLKQGRRARGAMLATAGLLMWPFRWDWVRFALRQTA